RSRMWPSLCRAGLFAYPPLFRSVEFVGRRIAAVAGRRVARGSIVHAFVVSCSCVGALTAGFGSGAGDVDGEDHAHLAVRGDRAPPVEVLTDDADVEGG